MSIFRRLSARGLAALVGAIAVFGASAAIAVTALGGGGSTPPAKPLGQAVHDALAADPVDGVTAQISFTNRLLGSSTLGSLAKVFGSPLLSDATGRLWLTNDGHLRIELQSDAGNTQIVCDGKMLTVYDASSNTAYQLALPTGMSAWSTDRHAVPSVAQIDLALALLGGFANISDATPDSVAGQPAYTVRVSPKADGGLLGAVELSWDAATGVPLHAAIYAKDDPKPVLALTVTDISYGPVATSDVDVAPPPGAKIVPVSLPSGGLSKHNAAPVTGVDAVAAAVPFTLAAPDTLDGLDRGAVRLIGSSTNPGALVTYGEGLGTVVVIEHAASGSDKDMSELLAMLPTVSINGSTGHELVTPLGTIVEFESGGVSYVVAGSVTQSDAEQAARALAP